MCPMNSSEFDLSLGDQVIFNRWERIVSPLEPFTCVWHFTMPDLSNFKVHMEGTAVSDEDFVYLVIDGVEFLYFEWALFL